MATKKTPAKKKKFKAPEFSISWDEIDRLTTDNLIAHRNMIRDFDPKSKHPDDTEMDAKILAALDFLIKHYFSEAR